ncbi:MAG TPA: hypothetical protein VEX35_05150 [Allosphingosinicella sp.]|nr:hypothetical protein [Allosphingosinicella sp.]
MTIILFAAATALTTLPVIAQAPLPRLENQVLLGGCRQGECSWLRVISMSRVSRVPQGELRRIELRRGSSPDPGRRRPRIAWQPETRTNYVFCSTARPTYAFEEEDGGLITHYLDLFDLAGYQQSSGQLYARFCHGRALTTGRLRALGYRPGTRSEQIEGGSPEDLTRF